MMKKLLCAVLLWMSCIGLVLADVEINTADLAALDGVKGIGAIMSKKMLDERAAHGPFKDWADLQKRVKGIGDKSSVQLSAAGLRVNGQAKAGTASQAAASSKPAASAKTAASAATSAATWAATSASKPAAATSTSASAAK